MSAWPSRGAADEAIKAAHGYIARGWPVFVLSPSKVPVALCGSEECEAHRGDPEASEACKCLCCHGFYAGTLDPDRAEEQIGRHPRGLLAVRTGAPSGTVVIDVDAPDGLVTMRALMADNLLPRTIAQQTGRDGYHFPYAHPGVRIPSGAGKGGPKVDIKADGGYIVVAPSVHPQTRRPYRWLTPFTDDLTPLPQAWVARLSEPVRVAPRLVQEDRPRSTHGRLHGLVAFVLDAKPNDRNGPLHWASCRAGELVAAGKLDQATAEAVLIDAAMRAGLRGGEPEARRTVASGMRSAGRRSAGVQRV